MKKTVGKKTLYSIIAIVIIVVVYLGGGVIKNTFFSQETKAINSLVSSIEDGAPFTMEFEDRSFDEKIKDYAKIDFDGTTYLLEDEDGIMISCEKGEKKCEEVESIVEFELNFIKTAFGKTYNPEISSDDNYSYSKGLTEDNQDYLIKVSNDGKKAVDEFNLGKPQGSLITTTLK